MNCKIEIINKIIEKEWMMFYEVNGNGPKAECQENKPAFTAMRKAQFLSWSKKVLNCYLEDIKDAEINHRNLVLQKYVFMMKSTAPEQYKKAAHLVTEPDGEKEVLVEEINSKLMEQTISLFAQYPKVASTGRPIHTKEDDMVNTSIETYQRGELCTYSIKTLTELKKHLDDLEEKGISLAKIILENTIKAYGFETLEEAEETTKERMSKGIQIGYKRCPACS